MRFSSKVKRSAFPSRVCLSYTRLVRELIYSSFAVGEKDDDGGVSFGGSTAATIVPELRGSISWGAVSGSSLHMAASFPG